VSAPRILRLALACAIGACGGRAPYWDNPVGTAGITQGLAKGVALVDDADHRVVMLTAVPDQELKTRSFPIGHHVVSAVASPKGDQLLVLSAGDSPRRTKNDEYPSLTVIDASSFEPSLLARYTMSGPLASWAVDPLGEWAVAYAGSGTPASFVQNANELVIFDLKTPGSTPVSRPIRSYGGTPQRLTFTPSLNLPKGPGRLLIVETDIDVTLLELDNNNAPEVTIPLTSDPSGQTVTPAGVVVEDSDPTNPTPPRIALRAVGNRNVFVFTLGPSDTNDFAPSINLTDVGGVPTDIAFVHVDQGALRVAALVPAISSAVLIDPVTTITTQVALPAAYSKLSLITSDLGSTTGTDVAMLWGAGDRTGAGVAFWTLGNAVGQPYFSVEALSISRPIQTVDDIALNRALKVLETADASGFLVLDLHSRTASPLQTASKATLEIAPDGLRVWAFEQGGTRLSSIDFASLTPVQALTDSPIDAVYDVARGDGGRSLIAIHKQGTVGATVFDALKPDPATSRRVPALLLEGP
jgi:hypothetical protein